MKSKVNDVCIFEYSNSPNISLPVCLHVVQKVENRMVNMIPITVGLKTSLK